MALGFAQGVFVGALASAIVALVVELFRLPPKGWKRIVVDVGGTLLGRLESEMRRRKLPADAIVRETLNLLDLHVKAGIAGGETLFKHPEITYRLSLRSDPPEWAKTETENAPCGDVVELVPHPEMLYLCAVRGVAPDRAVCDAWRFYSSIWRFLREDADENGGKSRFELALVDDLSGRRYGIDAESVGLGGDSAEEAEDG